MRLIVTLFFMFYVVIQAVFSQSHYTGTYYKVEESKAARKRAISISEISLNTYHFRMEKSRLLLSFTSPLLLEKFYDKKITKLSLYDTNGSYQKEWTANQLKKEAETILVEHVKHKFDKDLDKDRAHLLNEFIKVLGGTTQDSINSLSVIEATRTNPDKVNESVNHMLNKSYPVASFNKLQQRLNIIVDKYNAVRSKNQSDIQYFLDKPQRILDEILAKGIEDNWTFTLDTLSEKSFSPSGFVLDFYGGKKWNWLAFRQYPEISLVRLKFDTINGKALSNLVLVDTNQCKSDMMFASFDAKHNHLFAHNSCNNLTKINCFGVYTPTAWQHENFTVKFAKGESKDMGHHVKPRVDDIYSRNVHLRHVKIVAFSSVEGDSLINANLAHARSEQIIKEFKRFSKDSISYEIEMNENWDDFIKDMPEFKYYEKWKNLDRLSLRKEVNYEGVREELEPWLDKHRYAYVEMSYSQDVPKDHILEKVKEDYDSAVSNYSKHGVQSEMNIASIRNYVINQYRHKIFKIDEIKPFFTFTTPRLDMINFYQQYPLYKKHLPTLNASFDSILIRALRSSVELYEISAKNNTGQEVNNRGVNSPQHQLKSFQIQLYRFAVKMAQEGHLDKELLTKWKFPKSDDYQFLALKAMMKDVQESDYSHAQESYADKEMKTKDSVYTISLLDYKLKPCILKVVCKESPFYTKVKEDLTKHSFDETYDNTVSEVLWQFFIENQLIKTDIENEKLYDIDITPDKVLEYLDKFSSHICPSKKDKMYLTAYKNLAIWQYKHGDLSNVKHSLSYILSYYSVRKELLTPDVVDGLIRFLVYFQPIMEHKNESEKEIIKFIHSIHSKDFILSSSLINKLNYLHSKGEY